MEAWKEESWYFQQQLFHLLGDRKWDAINSNRSNVLKKIEFAFEICFGKDYSEQNEVQEIVDKVTTNLLKFFIQKHYNKNFSFTFINIKLKSKKGENGEIIDGKQGMQCIFWLQNANGSEICLDLFGRNYKSWNDFLEHNLFPKCDMIYPKTGRYCDGRDFKEDFVDLMFAESIACSEERVKKSDADTVAAVGSVLATGVLLFNPVSGPIFATASAVGFMTGLYNIGNCIEKLDDIDEHQGGVSLENPDALLALGELAITATCTAAVGASAGMRTFFGRSGALLNEGTMALKLAQKIRTITKFSCGLNVCVNLAILISKYEKGELISANDLKSLAKCIFVSCNIIICEKLLKSVISFLAEHFSVNEIIEFGIGLPKKITSAIKKAYTFVSEWDLQDVIKIILPNAAEYLERFSKIKTFITGIVDLADRVWLEIRNNEFDQNSVSRFSKEFQVMWRYVSNYKKQNQKEIKRRFDNPDVWSTIDEWTKLDGVDLQKKYSKFDRKINTPFVMYKKVTETISICCKNIESRDELEQKEKEFFTELFKLLKLHGWENKSPDYIYSKINFYCDTFQNLYSNESSKYYLKYFKYSPNNAVDKRTFFRNKCEIDDIQEHAYNFALDRLKKNIAVYHKQFEEDFVCSSFNDKQEKNTMYEFEMRSFATGLSEDDFYKKSKELVPELEARLNDECTTFDECGSIAYIVSKQEQNNSVQKQTDFVLVFYTEILDTYAKGVLLLIEKEH